MHLQDAPPVSRMIVYASQGYENRQRGSNVELAMQIIEVLWKHSMRGANGPSMDAGV